MNARALAGFHAALTRRYAVGVERPDGEGRAVAYRMQARWFPPSGAAVEPGLHGGAPADFVVLSADPLTVSLAQLPRIAVLATVSRGRITFASVEFRRGLSAGAKAQLVRSP